MAAAASGGAAVAQTDEERHYARYLPGDCKWTLGKLVNAKEGVQFIDNEKGSCGSYGAVVFGVPRPDVYPTAEPCVLKFMNREFTNRRADFRSYMTKAMYEREVAVMEYLNDARGAELDSLGSVVKYYQGWINEEFEKEGKTLVDCVFAVELLSGGDLLDNLQARYDVSEFTIMALMKPVFESVAKLHQLRILHLDLKVENLVFRRPPGDFSAAEVVIIDFGLAYTAHWPGEPVSTVRLNNVPYYPKEILDCWPNRQQPLSPAVDAYCLGYMLLKMFTKGNRASGRYRGECGDDEFLVHCSDGEDRPWSYSENLKDLIKGMLRPLYPGGRRDNGTIVAAGDPDARLTMKQVLASPWWGMARQDLSAALELAEFTLGTAVDAAAARAGGAHAPPVVNGGEWSAHYNRIVVQPKYTSMVLKVRERRRVVLGALAERVKLACTPPARGLSPKDLQQALEFVGLRFLAPENEFSVANPLLFKYCDFNGNGFLDHREVTVLLVATGLFTMEEIMANFTFKFIDTDDSGGIDQNELARHLSCMVLARMKEEPEHDDDVEPLPGGAAAGAAGGQHLHLVRSLSAEARLGEDALRNVFTLMSRHADSITPDSFAEAGRLFQANDPSIEPAIRIALEHIFSFALLDPPQQVGAAAAAAGGASDAKK